MEAVSESRSENIECAGGSNLVGPVPVKSDRFRAHRAMQAVPK